MRSEKNLPGLPNGIEPYDWALKQLRTKAAHKITKGSKNLVVAVIDLGYTHHPCMEGHLWENPNKPEHGWDCADDDASLENNDDSGYHNYKNGHHVFVAGEVASMAPKCPIMIVRVGYMNPDSWWMGIRYAVDHGAKVLVMPHGYLTGNKSNGTALFYQGADFTFPSDNVQIREAIEYAYDNNCLIVRGVAGNRGRRVATAMGFDAILNMGSSNRHDKPANICCSADYTEIGAPGGQRGTGIDQDTIWGYGPDENYISFTGGCMASGFGGGAAALVWSQFPKLSNDEVRQVLRNTARPVSYIAYDNDDWEPRLGYGIVDVGKAVSLKKEELCRNVHLIPDSVKVIEKTARYFLEATVENKGVFDAGKALIIVFNGDPCQPADPNATREKPAPELQTCQIGHTITRVRGFHKTEIKIELLFGLMEEFKPFKPEGEVWVEIFYLDRHDKSDANYMKLKL